MRPSSVHIQRDAPAHWSSGDAGRLPKPSRRRWTLSGASSHLLTIATSFMGAQAVASLLGAVFWSTIAHRYSVESVGVASAAISSMTVLGLLGVLGMGTLLMSLGPESTPERARSLLRAALVVVGVACTVLGLVWALCVRWLHEVLHPIGDTLPHAALFTAGVVLFGITVTLDYSLMATARGALQFARNVVAAVAKLAAIFVCIAISAAGGMSVYAAWTIGLAVSVPVCYRQFRRQASAETDRFAGYRELRRMWRDAAGHHVLNLSIVMPNFILPVLAALTTTAADTAYFTAGRLVSSFFGLVPYALAIALFAQSGTREAMARERIRVTLPLGFALSALMFLIALTSAGTILTTIFGGPYSTGAAVDVFIITALAPIPLVIKDHYVAMRRIQRRLGGATKLIIVGTVMEIGFALAGGWIAGVAGLCWGWVLALVIEALIMARPVAAMWSRRPTSVTSPSPERGQPPCSAETPSKAAAAPASGHRPPT